MKKTISIITFFVVFCAFAPTDKTKGTAKKSQSSVYKGHNLPRLRGTMISPGRFGHDDLEVLAGKWNANHVRWQLIWGGFPNGPADSASIKQYDEWLERQCQRLDVMLPEFKKYGVYVSLDLHTPPGGRIEDGWSMRIFHNKEYREHFIAVWKKLAQRYKDAEMIWAYDLLNEPNQGNIPRGMPDWRGLALETSKEIRKIDPEKAIIFESYRYGDPIGFKDFEPFNPEEVPNVVYSAHMYIPHDFTHQGVGTRTTGLDYPGEIDGKYWDKKALREELKYPIELSKKYGVAIYIGEFGAIRWAPNGSAYRYLKDCIDIFEEEGWDWAYHAFREWHGFSAEHGPDINNNSPSPTPTDREMLLRKWFKKNKHP